MGFEPLIFEKSSNARRLEEASVKDFRFPQNPRHCVESSKSVKSVKKLALLLSVTMLVTVMAVNTQFSIAVHIMAGLACRSDKETTSTDLARSVNTSPSFVRRVVAKLSKAGLVETSTGKAGACWLSREGNDISLLEVYRAVGAPKAFCIHHYSEQKACLVSCNIKAALDKALQKTQKAMEESLAGISLAEVVREVKGK
ncbi:MAG: Rrf2 family transcriptional regulator [Verrucomicrobiales bacterium]|nr:Rrf2 family transcriptional regulator [Verrucomicrobiales bacterium]